MDDCRDKTLMSLRDFFNHSWLGHEISIYLVDDINDIDCEGYDFSYTNNVHLTEDGMKEFDRVLDLPVIYDDDKLFVSILRNVNKMIWVRDLFLGIECYNNCDKYDKSNLFYCPKYYNELVCCDTKFGAIYFPAYTINKDKQTIEIDNATVDYVPILDSDKDEFGSIRSAVLLVCNLDVRYLRLMLNKSAYRTDTIEDWLDFVFCRTPVFVGSYPQFSRKYSMDDPPEDMCCIGENWIVF